MTTTQPNTRIGHWLRHSTHARTDAEALLCHVLNKPRSYLFSHAEQTLSEEQLGTLNEASRRVSLGEPLAYITGKAEFWSLELAVSPDVLIPRDDTGCLVEVALTLHKQVKAVGAVVDAGTGSGAVAIAFSTETRTPIIALDRSRKALAIAKHNVQQHADEWVSLVCGDWLTALAPQSVRLLLSNPPYIAENDPHLNVDGLQYEPQQALVSGPSGLDDIHHLANDARRVLVSGGALAVEHGYDQRQPVHSVFEQAGLQNIACVKDLAGNDRVTFAFAP